jgi:hypothetical protein
MAAGEQKVSLMDRIMSAPGNAKLYIVLDDNSYGYILKSDFLSGVSGGSGLRKAVYEETDISVPAGFSGVVINLNDTNASVTYTVDGELMTITDGATNGDVLIF